MPTLAATPITFAVTRESAAERMILRDGAVVVLRPMRESDIDLLADMHERLSPDTLYFRYLHPYKPTRDELACLARLNNGQGAAFVAVTAEEPERVVGIALYCRETSNPTIAQPAFLIEDAFQCRGLGQALSALLIEHALLDGISALNTTIHPSNAKMMRLIQKAGFPYQARLEYGALEIRISLHDP